MRLPSYGVCASCGTNAIFSASLMAGCDSPMWLVKWARTLRTTLSASAVALPHHCLPSPSRLRHMFRQGSARVPVRGLAPPRLSGRAPQGGPSSWACSVAASLGSWLSPLPGGACASATVLYCVEDTTETPRWCCTGRRHVKSGGTACSSRVRGPLAVTLEVESLSVVHPCHWSSGRMRHTGHMTQDSDLDVAPVGEPMRRCSAWGVGFTEWVFDYVPDLLIVTIGCQILLPCNGRGPTVM